MGLSFAGLSHDLTVPAGFSVFTTAAPPWVATKEAILGLARGEERPSAPSYAGPVPMSGSGRWTDLSQALADGSRSGPVSADAIRSRLIAGLQFVPVKSGRAMPLWSTWHENLLRSLSSVFSTWNSQAVNPALVIETAYASETFLAMADALAAVDTSHGAPEFDSEDPVFARANAYTASLISWLNKNEGDIVEGILAYAAFGTVTPALASAVTSVATGAATLGPVGIIALDAAILFVAVYAFVTGARPGTTRGAGDDVLAFPRSGTDADHITYLGPADVDAYAHAMYRAILLDRKRKSAGTRPWEARAIGFKPIEYHPSLRPIAPAAVDSKMVTEGEAVEGKLPPKLSTPAKVAIGVSAAAGGASLLWYVLKAFGIIRPRSRR